MDDNTPTLVPPPIEEEPKPKKLRGFAAMDRELVRKIASTGGKAAHAAGTAHEFSPEEARAAGKKGGIAVHVRRGGVRKKKIDTTPGEKTTD